MEQDPRDRSPLFQLNAWCRAAGVVACLLVACGTEPIDGATESILEETTPAVSSVSPSSITAGSTLTIRGRGFSAVAGENIVWIGSHGVVAERYLPVDPPTASEIDEIRVSAPTSLAAGPYSIMVQVGDLLSNTDVNLMITP